MISGATNKFSLYSQPRHFANSFQAPSPWPPRLLVHVRDLRLCPFEKVPAPGNDFACGAGSGRLSLSFPQVATSVHEKGPRFTLIVGTFPSGRRTVAFT